MKFILLLLFSFSASSSSWAANMNPMKVPVWSDLEKYQSKTTSLVPFLKQNYIVTAGFNYGFKNGLGFDGSFCKKLSRYLCGGGRLFLGTLNSQAIVRSPTGAELLVPAVPTTTEYQNILVTPESWFAFVPEIGLTVNSQIIPLMEDLWSESAWFGFGRAYIGGRSGWAISFEPGINKRIAADSGFGWTLRAKYTFGWLYTKNEGIGTIPFDWFNLTAGLLYVW